MNKSFNVFLVDDDEIFSVIAKVTLSKLYENVQFTCLPNGEAALKKICSCKPSDMPAILFLDINMPVMGGWDFLEALEQVKSATFPICMTSSSVDPKDIQMAKENSRVIEFMEKPLDRIKTKALIDTVLA